MNKLKRLESKSIIYGRIYGTVTDPKIYEQAYINTMRLFNMPIPKQIETNLNEDQSANIEKSMILKELYKKFIADYKDTKFNINNICKDTFEYNESAEQEFIKSGGLYDR